MGLPPFFDRSPATSPLRLLCQNSRYSLARASGLARVQPVFAAVKAVLAAHGTDAMAGDVLSSDQTSERRGAVVGATLRRGESHASPAQPIQIERLVETASKTSKVGPTQVVGLNKTMLVLRGCGEWPDPVAARAEPAKAIFRNDLQDRSSAWLIGSFITAPELHRRSA